MAIEYTFDSQENMVTLTGDLPGDMDTFMINCVQKWEKGTGLIIDERWTKLRAINELEKIEHKDSASFMDRVYMNGELKRQDYTITTTQGQAIVDILEAEFPDEENDWNATTHNLVSQFNPDRPPYENPSISWYNFLPPEEAVRTRFGASYTEYMPWYGLKFDRTTNEVLAKFVIPVSQMDDNILEDLHIGDQNGFMRWGPEGIFFAKIHDTNGNVNENVDVYFMATEDDMLNYCNKHDYTFPYDVETQNRFVFLWSLVFNETTKEISHIKAYEREYI